MESYWKDRSSLWKLDELLDPIADTDRDARFVSLDKLDSGGKLVSLCTRECRLFEESCDGRNDWRRRADPLRSALEIDRYSPPGCKPMGEVLPGADGEGEGVRRTDERARFRLPSINCETSQLPLECFQYFTSISGVGVSTYR